MKFAHIAVIVMAFSACVLGQTPGPSRTQTNVEQFSQRSGRLISKEFIDVGSIRTVEIKVLKITDLSDGKTTNGLRFSKTVASAYSSDEKTAFLDADEIDGLTKSLATLKNVVLTTPTNYTEIVFMSRGGFEAGAYWSRDKKWMIYLQLEQYGRDATVFMPADEIPKLSDLIESAKANLR